MIIYNLFPPLAGTLKQWDRHYERAADMGFEWIFVNPIQKPGGSRSLYSIADYFQINPRILDTGETLSPDQQVRARTRAANNLGLRMMVDLVINHCAADSELIRQHPEWFVHESDGRIAHPSCIDKGKSVVWKDLARFNHEHTPDPDGLYRYVWRIVEYLVQLGFEGFRCDAAYQIPRHFWARLIGEVKSRYPDTVFVAETLGCTADQTRHTAQAGFDYVFNSSKWWDLHNPWLLAQYQLTREVAPSISFPESHDTERLFQEMNGNVAIVKQRFLLASFFSAGSMMPCGFEFGFRKRLHVVETRPEEWETPNIDLRNFIGRVNGVKKRYKIFREECPTAVLPYENPNILLLWKASSKTSEEALIVLNKDAWHHQHFGIENLNAAVRARAPLRDVSPEYSLDFIPNKPFSYDLRPGQGFVFVTEQDRV
jgi:starch synthase (maltosyl-transferring)